MDACDGCRASGVRELHANIHAEMRRVGAWRVNWETKIVWVYSPDRNPVGADMNQFVHRLIMSMLLVAVLVLVWNVLGSR